MTVEYYGGTVIEALSTDTWPDVPDGWFLKALDTGESYIRREGAWEYINLGLAFIKATKSGNVTTDASGLATVTFNTPFINDNYSIALTCSDVGRGPGAIAYKYDRLSTGFKIITRNPVSGLAKPNIGVSWLCTRDYDP